ncbi:MAG: T9SS type A sorting domain-containing protein [Bacteroidetes bacterium]|nr:T9SS type A sorting domain-containing protein [Bacteroidota bacterium]
MKKYTVAFLLLAGFSAYAQFPPAAGQAGTTAIYKDNSIFVGWASNCTVNRGFVNIANPSLGKVTTGTPEMAIGKSGTSGLVSLGDGGTAVLTFEAAIYNGPGWDFAVFENAFDGFIELAFVEVSSDGINFFRFPATSLTDTTVQTGTFGLTDPTKIDNLAGKYDLFYGTPFDLEELKDEPGLDIGYITHVKIIDVVGSMDPLYATRDAAGRKINEPWPTPFPQGGFDLDAIGVIHQKPLNIKAHNKENIFRIYPVPAKNVLNISTVESNEKFHYAITDISGKAILSGEGMGMEKIDTSHLLHGFYLVNLRMGAINIYRKILITE